MTSARVTELWRYPVKSMQGERLDAADVTEAGVVGDRAWAVIDDETGKVASAKHPRKWARLLECRAALAPDGGVRVELPDGTTVGSEDVEKASAALSSFLGRDVALASSAGVPAGGAYEMMWPGIDGLAPAEFISQTTVSTEPTGEAVSDVTVGLAAPGSFFDVAPLHVVTTATLGALAADVRRLRPNVVVELDDAAAFAENEWMGRTMTVGSTLQLALGIPTMRCVMTTLPQPGLAREVAVLQAVAKGNRVEIPGFGTWACAGAYSGVLAGGPARVGDVAALD